LVPKDVSRLSFGSSTPLDALLTQLTERGSLTPVRGKAKAKRFVATKTGIPVDIYVATPETWATLLLIRTGSKQHNIKLAQRAKTLGMKLRASGDGIEVKNGELRRVGTEEEIFSLLELQFLPPEERN
jgi:DNA polymerase/3'-5' exonuclease PolX